MKKMMLVFVACSEAIKMCPLVKELKSRRMTSRRLCASPDSTARCSTR